TPYFAPEMARVREAVDLVLRGHEPYPAYVTDRFWNLVTANAASALLLEGVAKHLLAPPVNAMRLGLHPDGLAPRVLNFEEYSGHHLATLRRHVEATGDPDLAALYEELRRYPGVKETPPSLTAGAPGRDVVVSLRFKTNDGELSLFNTVASFGTAVDITLDQLVIELLHPADDTTRRALHARAEARAAGSAPAGCA
ncbi:MAG: transcriptional regulator, partial [Burkholderiales bacterium]